MGKYYKHLGVTMTHIRSDWDDIKKKKGDFIGRANNVLQNTQS